MKEYLRERISAGLQSLGLAETVTPTFERPHSAGHGDLTTNVAMIAAKAARTNPRKLARQLLDRIELDSTLVDKVEIAGPGFINFRFTGKFYREQLKQILTKKNFYGHSNIGKPLKTQVEFVSANPTGPLTVGHGRGAVYGDTVARLLEWTNHDVTREYYFNNAGRQMRILGDSVRLRYLELLGDAIVFPDDYYQGEYIKEIAQRLVDHRADSLRNEAAEGIFKQQAEQEIFDDIKKTLKRLDIVHDVFYNENSLYETGKVKEVIEEFKQRGLAYDQDGAVWLKTSVLGGEKDKVIVKGTGEPTYRLPDIAYHREKLRRGFELVIDVLGADHVATYPDVLAGLKALGFDPAKIKVLIHQFVTIVQNGEVVKMSTRKANFITLDELIDEVGADVARYFFLMRGAGSHLNFDLGLAKEQSEQNPVYYLQYAHARIASIIRNAESQGIDVNVPADLSLLAAEEELGLIKMLVNFPDMVESCAASFEPHRLAEYLHDVAGSFHKFYHVHKVLTDDRALAVARCALCLATKTVIANGFAILGITAPEKM
ncbi:MAG: arginine--tRNA ligase [Ignavibacteriae bacterium]|nr:arginine--tRNA ligase [Ignavibacteria bacterium]MBI3364306.1 arginine--tRNA ligase [Ignavibacteriota bacterium]